MGKYCDPNAIDAALNLIKSTSNRLVLCSAQPANFAGVAAVTLADVAIDAGDFTGPEAGAVSGRKITIAAIADIPVSASGIANHIALVDDTNARLRYVTTTPAKAVAAAGTANMNAWSIEIADPA